MRCTENQGRILSVYTPDPGGAGCDTLSSERRPLRSERPATMSDKPSRSTVEAIYEELRDRICLLDLPPGAPLRAHAIAEECGDSRTAVREALRAARARMSPRPAPGGAAQRAGDRRGVRSQPDPGS